MITGRKKIGTLNLVKSVTSAAVEFHDYKSQTKTETKSENTEEDSKYEEMEAEETRRMESKNGTPDDVISKINLDNLTEMQK